MTIADVKDIITIGGPFLGFLLGWGLFELRQALVAELRHTELLLSSIVSKFAYLATTGDEIQRVASEIRWFAREAPSRAQVFGLREVPSMPDAMIALPDGELVRGFVLLSRKENIGSTVILPVVDAALAGHTSGFTAPQIEALSSLRWQGHLLEQDAEWMAEFFRMTYTVEDAENHALVVDNRMQKVRSYAKRADVMLGCVRTALDALGASRV